MKIKFLLTTAIVLSLLNGAFAQNTFPSAGNVGIGTITPANKLTIKGDGPVLSQESADGSTKVGFYTAGGFAYVQTHTNHPLHFTANNAGPKMTLLVNGNFGIGTTSPGVPLEVVGKAKIGIVEISSPGQFFDNTAIGYKSLSLVTGSNVNATSNVAVGYQALELNTDGAQNCAAGYSSLRQNTSGSYNTATGYSSLINNTTGFRNTAMGNFSMQGNTTGSLNTAIGFNTLNTNSTGNNNTVIGSGANTNANGYSNVTAIGSSATATASNQVRIGNSSVTSIGGYAGWTNVSDARVKRNIQENVPGLDFINKLTPVTYKLDLAAADKIIGIDHRKTMDAEAVKTKEQQTQTGFLAQDVETAAKTSGYDFSGVDVPKNDKDLYGLRYAEFVVPIVKAVQELSKMNEEKDAQIKNLQQQIDELKEMMKAGSTAGSGTKQHVTLTAGGLQQNAPNPFNNVTAIAYTLPEKYNHAKIVFTDKSNKTIKEVVLTGKGSGMVNINSSTLNAGTYQYSLYINNVLAETKQMMIIK
jgi:trimeric autotransporter adhesin